MIPRYSFFYMKIEDLKQGMLKGFPKAETQHNKEDPRHTQLNLTAAETESESRESYT